MPAQRSPYFRGLPIVPLVLATGDLHDRVVRRLLVDSGFTGESDLILSIADCTRFGQRFAEDSTVGGAIQGTHQRVWVAAEIPELLFQADLIAIAADVSALGLPDGIDGLAGLSFLSQFHRWGAEQNQAGTWEFVLEK